MDSSLPYSVTDYTIEELYSRSGKMDMLQKQKKKVKHLRDALASSQESKLSSSLAVV